MMWTMHIVPRMCGFPEIDRPDLVDFPLEIYSPDLSSDLVHMTTTLNGKGFYIVDTVSKFAKLCENIPKALREMMSPTAWGVWRRRSVPSQPGVH